MFGRNPVAASKSNKRKTLNSCKKEFGGISHVQRKGKDALGPQEITGT